uniref:DUF3786 domain-containing protein n=1 Tax=Thermofilum pendens TaxID=2269 RepID=A0A7C4BAG6_THEPE
MSFWELYSWERVRDKIRSLPGRLGFEKGDKLSFFGLTLDLETGYIYDNVLEEYLSQKDRIGMYFILSLYAETKIDVGESGEFISLRQICPFVHCPNLKKNIAALEMIFGENPKLLYTVAKPFDFKPADLGDAAIKVYALPRIPITLVVWAGEEGLPPSSEILFDKSAPHYLSGETSAVCEAALGLARALTGRLILKFAKNLEMNASAIEFGGCGYTCAE